MEIGNALKLMCVCFLSAPLTEQDNSYSVRLRLGGESYECKLSETDSLVIDPSYLDLNTTRVTSVKELDGVGFRTVSFDSDQLTGDLAKSLFCSNAMFDSLTSEGAMLSPSAEPIHSSEKIGIAGIAIVSIRDTSGNVAFVGYFGSEVKRIDLHGSKIVFLHPDGSKQSYESLQHLAKATNKEFGNMPERNTIGAVTHDKALTVAGFSKYGTRVYFDTKESWNLQESAFQSLVLEHKLKLIVDQKKNGGNVQEKMRENGENSR